MGVVKEGSMCVQSQTLWRRWSWDRKYMVLTHDYLQYIEHCTTTTTPHTPQQQRQHTTLYLHGDVSLTIRRRTQRGERSTPRAGEVAEAEQVL
eukprot:UN00757